MNASTILSRGSRVAAATLLVASPALAQIPTYAASSTYGTPGGRNHTLFAPSLRSDGAPVLGQTMRIDVSAPGAQVAILMASPRRVPGRTLALGADLLRFHLDLTAVTLTLPVVLDAEGAGQLSSRLPDRPSLLGAELNFQSVVFEAATSGFGTSSLLSQRFGTAPPPVPVLPASAATRPSTRFLDAARPGSRYQMVYDGSEVGPEQVFHGLALRLPATHPGTSHVAVDLEIAVGPTTRSPSTLSPVFAQNASASTLTTVFRGWVSYPAIAAAPPDPTWFPIEVVWDQPFSWTPGPGENLLIEIRNRASSGSYDVAVDGPGASMVHGPIDGTSGLLTAGLGLAVRLLGDGTSARAADPVRQSEIERARRRAIETGKAAMMEPTTAMLVTGAPPPVEFVETRPDGERRDRLVRAPLATVEALSPDTLLQLPPPDRVFSTSSYSTGSPVTFTGVSRDDARNIHDGDEPDLQIVIVDNRVIVRYRWGTGGIASHDFRLEGFDLEQMVREALQNPPPKPSRAECDAACARGARTYGNYRLISVLSDDSTQIRYGSQVWEFRWTNSFVFEYGWDWDCDSGTMRLHILVQFIDAEGNVFDYYWQGPAE